MAIIEVVNNILRALKDGKNPCEELILKDIKGLKKRLSGKLMAKSLTCEEAYAVLLVELHELLYQNKSCNSFYSVIATIEEGQFLYNTNSNLNIYIFKDTGNVGCTFLAYRDSSITKLENWLQDNQGKEEKDCPISKKLQTEPLYFEGDTVLRSKKIPFEEAISDYVEEELQFTFEQILQLLCWNIQQGYHYGSYGARKNGIFKIDNALKSNHTNQKTIELFGDKAKKYADQEYVRLTIQNNKCQKLYVIKGLLHLFNGELLLSNLAFKLSDTEISFEKNVYDGDSIAKQVTVDIIEYFFVNEEINCIKQKIDYYFLENNPFSQLAKLKGINIPSLKDLNNSCFDDEYRSPNYEDLYPYWRKESSWFSPPIHIKSKVKFLKADKHLEREDTAIQLCQAMKQYPEKVCELIERIKHFTVDPCLFLFSPIYSKRILSAYGINLTKPHLLYIETINDMIRGQDAEADYWIDRMSKDGLDEAFEGDSEAYYLWSECQ